MKSDDLDERRLQSAEPGRLACVTYECTATMEITYVSGNVYELLNIMPKPLSGTRSFCQDKIFAEDFTAVTEGLRIFQDSGFTSMIHRLLDDTGLPKWVAHGLCKSQLAGEGNISGCLIPIRPDLLSFGLDRNAISRFVHKIGNHFQLLTLLVSALRKKLTDSRELNVLEDTVDKAVQLTRTFSEFAQVPVCFSELNLAETLGIIVQVRNPLFRGKGITFDIEIDKLAERLRIRGDHFLLDSAIGGILQNALEATPSGGVVTVSLKAEKRNDGRASAATITIDDSGCGVAPENLAKVAEAFYTLKKDHNGLGLSLATRFVELHEGALSVFSEEGRGTSVRVVLPTVGNAN